MSGEVKLIGNIVLQGMKLLSESRKHRLGKEYRRLLDKRDAAENRVYPDYNDAEVALAQQDLNNFYSAFAFELEQEALEREKASEK